MVPWWRLTMGYR